MSKSSTTIRPVASPRRVTTHPGEVIAEEFLAPLGLSANALALALRVPATRIGAILKGDRAVSADTALAARPLLRDEPGILARPSVDPRPQQSPR